MCIVMLPPESSTAIKRYELRMDRAGKEERRPNRKNPWLILPVQMINDKLRPRTSTASDASEPFSAGQSGGTEPACKRGHGDQKI